MKNLGSEIYILLNLEYFGFLFFVLCDILFISCNIGLVRINLEIDYL